MQYTGGWEDLLILSIMSAMGGLAKWGKFSRPSLLIAFMLAGRVEKLTGQTFTIYRWTDLLMRPGVWLSLGMALLAIVLGFRNKNKLDYA
jgi:hypothetical protein